MHESFGYPYCYSYNTRFGGCVVTLVPPGPGYTGYTGYKGLPSAAEKFRKRRKHLLLLLSFFGGEGSGTAALDFAGELDHIAFDRAFIHYLDVIAAKAQHLCEGDGVTSDFAVGDGVFAALIGD